MNYALIKKRSTTKYCAVIIKVISGKRRRYEQVKESQYSSNARKRRRYEQDKESQRRVPIVRNYGSTQVIRPTLSTHVKGVDASKTRSTERAYR